MYKIIIGLALVFSSQVDALEVSKDQWVDSMKTELPVMFCKPAGFYKQCFCITATECEEAAVSAVRSCLSDLDSKIPDLLVQPKDGRYWSEKVGACGGAAYELSLKEKRISSEKCNNQNNWP